MEIDDKKIFKIALVTTLIGILGMMVFSTSINPKEMKIEEIDKNTIGEKVSIEGTVNSLKPSNSGKSYFLNLNDGTGEIKVILFESTITELKEEGVEINTFKDKKVAIFGQVAEYKGVAEILTEGSKSIKIVA
ncbi:MAG: OB-fold nucleic acid binding domain-containing protein [Methanobacteriaceae archaeon]